MLHVALDNRPQRLNRVQLWTVRRHEHQLEVEVRRSFSHQLSVMRGMVVKYYIELLIEGKLLPKQIKEIQHTFLVRGCT